MVCRQTSCLPEAGIPALLGRCLLAITAQYGVLQGSSRAYIILLTYPWVQESPQTAIHLDESEKKNHFIVLETRDSLVVIILLTKVGQACLT